MNFRFAAVAIIGFATWSSSQTSAAVLGKSWPASQQVSIDQIDHSPLSVLLKRYVDRDGYVDYTAWKASSRDRRSLLAYLQSLSRANITKKAAKAAKVAFWINAYNAVTIEGILRVYPTSSIRNHTAKVFGYNMWTELPLIVGSGRFSLDHMEHEILRKLGEPRIHFAIVCASIGCPRLQTEAYTAQGLEQQLARNAKDFFARRKNQGINRKSKILFLSSIMDWFGEDFGATQSKQLAAIYKYLPASAQELVVQKGASVKYLDYNWNLNDQKSRK